MAWDRNQPPHGTDNKKYNRTMYGIKFEKYEQNQTDVTWRQPRQANDCQESYKSHEARK
jgi:hypothetical protein